MGSRSFVSWDILAEKLSTFKTTLNIDGVTKEYIGFVMDLKFSPDSKHYAFVNYLSDDTGNPTNASLFLDGVKQNIPGSVIEHRFTPDSKKIVYVLLDIKGNLSRRELLLSKAQVK